MEFSPSYTLPMSWWWTLPKKCTLNRQNLTLDAVYT